MLSRVVGNLRAGRYRSDLEERTGWYAVRPDERERCRIQLALLNEQWQLITRESPYFQELSVERGLPSEFATLEEFSERVPAMNRATVQRAGSRLWNGSKPSEFQRITGGSTSQPIQMPAWNSELKFTAADMWVARSWYGISPASRLFLLWGHSHLLGSGVGGWIRGRKRTFYDFLVGYCRHSAYDLSEPALREGARRLIRFRPDYVIGYSVALDLFARAVGDLAPELREAGVKVVIATAEGFPFADSEARLSELFNCPVAMEYGSVETNVVAHTHPTGGYRVFWRTHLVEVLGEDRRGPILVTSLYPRATPLVRYELGDEIELGGLGERRPGIDAFERVIGRCNDFIALADGTPVHSEAVTHAVRGCSAIQSYQAVQQGGVIELRFISDRPLLDDEVLGIRSRLGRIHADLASVTLAQVERLEQTVAGKTPMVLRR